MRASNKDFSKPIVHSHNRQYYPVLGMAVLAVNIEAATARAEKIQAHKAMRLAKSNAKVSYQPA